VELRAADQSTFRGTAVGSVGIEFHRIWRFIVVVVVVIVGRFGKSETFAS
jgi:hypothetical protein